MFITVLTETTGTTGSGGLFGNGLGGMLIPLLLMFALLYFLAILWSVKIGTPKALTVICLTTGLVFLTVGLSGIIGGDYWHWVLGIVALLNFAFNFYLAVMLALEKPAW